MTANIPKFLTEVKSRLAANSGKIPAPLYFEIGKLCGMTCKDVVEAKREHFADQVKGATAGKPIAAKKVAKPAKKATKTAKPAKKATKPDDEVEVKLTKKQKKMIAEADESTGVVEQTEDTFVWIASPEEIASDKDIHETSY